MNGMRWYPASLLSVLMNASLSQSDPNEKVDPKYGKVLGIVSETKQNPTKPASRKEPYQDSDCVRTTTETRQRLRSNSYPGSRAAFCEGKKNPTDASLRKDPNLKIHWEKMPEKCTKIWVPSTLFIDWV